MTRPLRILFLVQHSQQLQMFEAGLSELARRGHHLQLAFPALHRSTVVAERLARQFSNVTVIGSLPVAVRLKGLDIAVGHLRRLQDDLRYLTPRYASFRVVRDEAERRYPLPVRRLWRRIAASPRAAHHVSRVLAALDRGMPLTAAARQFMADHPSDIVLASPLVAGQYLVDYVRLAKAAGIPTGLPVRSWDNLTTKGLLHVIPDGLIVWNDAQRREAFDEFGFAPERVAVVGAHSFDHWFACTPSPREQFCAAAGLPPTRPYLLYVASSKRIARDEPAFVSRWLAAIRAHDDPRVRDLSVLIRPHFQHQDPWRGWHPPVDKAVVAPPLGEMPIDAESRQAFFDALSHSLAVVGANTSAMIEAGIAGRPVLSIVVPEFGQYTMPHFHHLTNHGFVQTAGSFDEHCTQIRQVIDDRDSWNTGRRRFLETFVRPHGLERPAAPYFADAVEALTRLSASPASR